MRGVSLTVGLLAVTGCNIGSLRGDLTESEMRDAVIEVQAATRPDAAMAEVIDVSTDEAIGDRLETAIATMQAFWETQEPCSTVTVDGNKVTVDYGTLDDDCTFRDRTYAGLDIVTFEFLSDQRQLDVMHEFDAFTNGEVALDGTIDIRRRYDERSLQIVGDYTWVNFDLGTATKVESDHTMERLDPNLPVREGGLRLDGSRSWTTGDRTWSIDMQNIELYLDDPAPSAGVVDLTLPDDRMATIDFEKLDDGTILATVIRSDGMVRKFRIRSDGSVSSEGMTR